MKQFILIAILSLILSPASLAASSSFKTYTPLTPPPHHFHHHHHHRNNNLPIIPHSHNIYKDKNNVTNNIKKRWTPKRNYLNNGYYTYNSPYYNYYPQRQSLFSSIKSFFDSGNMTGYTPSNSSSFDSIPYGYQNSIQSPDGDYFVDDYGYKSGATVKILD